MPIPVLTAGQGLVPARLEIVRPVVADNIIPLRFNPTEYQLQKGNNFSEIAIPGLESPPIQFVRGGAEKLSVELLVDTSGTLEDVRVRYVEKLRGLMNLNIELHAPPIVRFVWDRQVFVGVLESLNVSYVLFTPEGVPLRAKLSVTLKEYRPAAVQVKEGRPPRRISTRRGSFVAAIRSRASLGPFTATAANGARSPKTTASLIRAG
jgi:hypothetical protein